MDCKMTLYQRALQELRPYLVEEVDCTEVLDHIIAARGLTDAEQDAINTTEPRRDKVRKLLDCMRYKDDAVFEAMLEGLKRHRCDHVIKRIQEMVEFIKQENQDPCLLDVDPSQIPRPRETEQIAGSANQSTNEQASWLSDCSPSIQHHPVSDRLITLVAMEIGDPSVLGGILGLPHAVVQQCRLDNSCSTMGWAVALLQTWKHRQVRKASVGALVAALEEGKLMTEGIRNVIAKEVTKVQGQGQVTKGQGQGQCVTSQSMKERTKRQEVFL